MRFLTFVLWYGGDMVLAAMVPASMVWGPFLDVPASMWFMFLLALASYYVWCQYATRHVDTVLPSIATWTFAMIFLGGICDPLLATACYVVGTTGTAVLMYMALDVTYLYYFPEEPSSS